MVLAKRLVPQGTIAGMFETTGQVVLRPGRWRQRGLEPTRGPAGEVRWWERPAPGGDEAMWDAVKAIHRRRISLGVSVCELARRLEAAGTPVDRSTLSRVLNGVQPTSRDLIAALADEVGADHPYRCDEAAA
jgi:hypothetical protein